MLDENELAVPPDFFDKNSKLVKKGIDPLQLLHIALASWQNNNPENDDIKSYYIEKVLSRGFTNAMTLLCRVDYKSGRKPYRMVVKIDIKDNIEKESKGYQLLKNEGGNYFCSLKNNPEKDFFRYNDKNSFYGIIEYGFVGDQPPIENVESLVNYFLNQVTKGNISQDDGGRVSQILEQIILGLRNHLYGDIRQINQNPFKKKLNHLTSVFLEKIMESSFLNNLKFNFGFNEKPVDANQLCKRLEHTLGGIAVSHYAESIHGDLNPSNILVYHNNGSSSGILIDFQEIYIKKEDEKFTPYFWDFARLEGELLLSALVDSESFSPESLGIISEEIIRNLLNFNIEINTESRSLKALYIILFRLRFSLYRDSINANNYDTRIVHNLKSYYSTLFCFFLFYTKYLYDETGELNTHEKIKVPLALHISVVLSEILENFETRNVIVNISESFQNTWKSIRTLHVLNPNFTRLPKNNSDGILSKAQFDSSEQRFNDEVFALELLVNNIYISRDSNKSQFRYNILLNRSGVEQIVINQKGKESIRKRFVPANHKELLEEETKIHSFMLGQSFKSAEKSYDDIIDIKLKKYPLFWASGGVLSIVNYKNKKWILFTFRDIKPYGWNLSLGSSERYFDTQDRLVSDFNHELNDPWNFIVREFLEEVLIIKGNPKPLHECSVKKLYLGNLRIDKNISDKLNIFSSEHINLRLKYDDLNLYLNNDSKVPHPMIDLRQDITNYSLEIIDSKKNRSRTTDVLVCFNLLELGIEIIKVLTFDIDDDDYILDGEIIINPDGTQELARMPVALISIEYLEGVFGTGCKNLERTKDEVDSSFICPPIPQDDLVLFDWDLKKRFNILNNPKNENYVGTELIRYKAFNESFSKYFNSEGKVSTAGLSEHENLFTPASVCALTQFFNQKNINKREN